MRPRYVAPSQRPPSGLALRRLRNSWRVWPLQYSIWIMMLTDLKGYFFLIKLLIVCRADSGGCCISSISSSRSRRLGESMSAELSAFDTSTALLSLDSSLDELSEEESESLELDSLGWSTVLEF